MPTANAAVPEAAAALLIPISSCRYVDAKYTKANSTTIERHKISQASIHWI